MKRGLVIAGAAFGVVVGVIVGLRLETSSLALLVGVVCGVVAGLPVSVGLLYALGREREARRRLEEVRRVEERPAVGGPPVVILNAGRGGELLSQMPLLGERTQREFVIVGEEEPAGEKRTDTHG